MPPSVAVIIPSLNEEAAIAGAIRSARRAGAHEIIVSDGGSTDATVERAEAAGARVIETERIRGKQMNAAAAAASSEILLFLHADTILPDGAIDLVSGAVERGALFGGFLLQFTERDVRLRLTAMMVNLRTRLTKCPWGDQAQFITRDRFQSEGGFREISIMEDYDLARRMKRHRATAILSPPVLTSGRRFLRRGILRTNLTNWRIVIAWRLGADPERLARIYRSEAGPQ